MTANKDEYQKSVETKI